MKQAKDLVAVLREANQVKDKIRKNSFSKFFLTKFCLHLSQEVDPKLQAMANRAGNFSGGNRRYGGGGAGGNRSNFGTFKRGQISNVRGGNVGGGYRGGQQNGVNGYSNGGGAGAPRAHTRFN